MQGITHTGGPNCTYRTVWKGQVYDFKGGKTVTVDDEFAAHLLTVPGTRGRPMFTSDIEDRKEVEALLGITLD